MKLSSNSLSIFLSFLFILLISCQSSTNQSIQTTSPAPVADIVRKANVIYDSAEFQKGIMHVPLYLSNGIIGGCFDHMGFQSLPNKGIPNGRTVLGYIGQYYMHKPSTRQAQLPLAYIQAQFADGTSILNMMDAKHYRQELDIYTGVLTTQYQLFGDTKINAFAHQTIPGLFIMKIDRNADSDEKDLIIKINCQAATSQQNDIGWPPDPVKLKFTMQNNRADVVSSTNMVNTNWTVATNADISNDGDQIIIHTKNGENIIRIYVHRDDSNDDEAALNNTYPQLLASHTAEWASHWERSWIDFPEERAHSIWNRANYYNLSNFPVIPEKALIPTGMNTNIWGFTFPQDVYYVAENLLRSGHFERYEKAMEYWLKILPEVKKYSVRIMEVEGGYYPWTPPFEQWDEFEKNGAVGNDSYEIHNPAYVSAMVWHYYQRTGDREFLKKYFPIMQEVWRFYSNVLHPNDNGKYDVDHKYSAGQDEASRLESSKNLLCASYSAEYSLRNYIEAVKILGDEDEKLFEKAKLIQSAGLERSTLLKPTGYYTTYEGDNRPINSQKHPVQLNAITFCPMGDLGTSDPSVKAWENRYDLTTQARKPVSHGWTFAAFALASSRLGKPEGLASDMTAAQYCAQADPRWIQFYEFTFWERFTTKLSYYFPTHGLYQQAFTDALVQDWEGYVNIFGCLLDNWKNDQLSFKGITTLNGVSVDAIWNKGKYRIELHPNQSTFVEVKVSAGEGSIKVSGDKNAVTTLQKGEVMKLEFNGNEKIVLSNE